MSTLNDVINLQLAKLEADATAIKAKAASDLAAVEAEVAATKVHLTGLLPWLHTELGDAKAALLGFFSKLEAHNTPAAPVAPVVQAVSTTTS